MFENLIEKLYRAPLFRVNFGLTPVYMWLCVLTLVYKSTNVFVNEKYLVDCRFELPFNIWCAGCGNHIGVGE